MTPEKCDHPMNQRWQWRNHWECCLCMSRFKGKKDEEESQPRRENKDEETIR